MAMGLISGLNIIADAAIEGVIHGLNKINGPI
jgi:hypothetical protein